MSQISLCKLMDKLSSDYSSIKLTTLVVRRNDHDLPVVRHAGMLWTLVDNWSMRQRPDEMLRQVKSDEILPSSVSVPLESVGKGASINAWLQAARSASIHFRVESRERPFRLSDQARAGVVLVVQIKNSLWGVYFDNEFVKARHLL